MGRCHGASHRRSLPGLTLDTPNSLGFHARPSHLDAPSSPSVSLTLMSPTRLRQCFLIHDSEACFVTHCMNRESTLLLQKGNQGIMPLHGLPVQPYSQLITFSLTQTPSLPSPSSFSSIPLILPP